jgi:nucleoside-diphosphate-sugar epimerase
MSTLKVYGDFVPDLKIRNEDSVCYPDDSYGRSKLEAETGLKKMNSPEFIVSVIRTSLVYGEGVKANMMSLVKLIEKLPVLPFKNISNKRNFTYTENLVGFIDQVIEKKAPGVFIAMDEKAISTTELVNYISKSLGRKIILFRVPPVFIRMGTRILPGIFDRLYGSLEVDNSKTLNVLDFKPPFSTEDGIKKMIDSYKKS